MKKQKRKMTHFVHIKRVVVSWQAYLLIDQNALSSNFHLKHNTTYQISFKSYISSHLNFQINE